MLRALLAGISGLRNHQLKMDVIGNNIANVNTVGFKSSRVTFQEGFAQVLAQAQASSWHGGGRNPSQVGSGAAVGAVDANFTQGTLEPTGQPLDLAIQGDALFAVSDGRNLLYSRAGNLRIDDTGRVVLGNTGMVVQGANANAAGQLSGGIGDLILRLDEPASPRGTSMVELSGNLDAAAEAGAVHRMTSTVYDKAGRSYKLELTLTRNEDGSWGWEAESDEATVTTKGSFVFSEDGSLEEIRYADGGSGLQLISPDGDEILIDLSAANGAKGLTSFSGASTAAVSSQDGFGAGELTDLRVGMDGTIEGVYSNGTTRLLGQVALATFVNPSGLLRGGMNLFMESGASGAPVIGFSGASTASSVISGALEGSNVDLSAQFTDMIVTQRGFQANARVITAADDMLAELIHLKR